MPHHCQFLQSVGTTNPNPAFPFTQTHLSSAVALILPPEADQSHSETAPPSASETFTQDNAENRCMIPALQRGYSLYFSSKTWRSTGFCGKPKICSQIQIYRKTLILLKYSHVEVMWSCDCTSVIIWKLNRVKTHLKVKPSKTDVRFSLKVWQTDRAESKSPVWTNRDTISTADALPTCETQTGETAAGAEGKQVF